MIYVLYLSIYVVGGTVPSEELTFTYPTMEECMRGRIVEAGKIGALTDSICVEEKKWLN